MISGRVHTWRKKGSSKKVETESPTPKQSQVSKKLDFTINKSSAHSTKIDNVSSSESTDSPCVETNSSKESVIIIDEEEEVELTSIHRNVGAQKPCSPLSSAISSASTRAELAALDTLIPPVSSTNGSVILQAEVMYNDLVVTDPFKLVQRPSEAVLQSVEKLLYDEKQKGNKPSAVQIRCFGRFSEEGLRILRKFCSIRETKHKVAGEARWLSEVNCTGREVALLQSVLWNLPVTSTILRFCRKSIDVISFSDLAEERYIDSFVIDVCVGKFVAESIAQGQNDTISFPTEFFQWMMVKDKPFKIKELKAHASQIAQLDNLQQILVPVFMVNHWGLIYVDLASQMLYFDDGLTSQIPSTALPCVKEALNLLFELCPQHSSLKTKFWHSTRSFQRFGMPSQVPIDKRMIGVGSCGIGVIMAARDFIRDGPATVNNIKWRYCNMHIYRKDLMLQILKWGGHYK